MDQNDPLVRSAIEQVRFRISNSSTANRQVLVPGEPRVRLPACVFLPETVITEHLVLTGMKTVPGLGFVVHDLLT